MERWREKEREGCSNNWFTLQWPQGEAEFIWGQESGVFSVFHVGSEARGKKQNPLLTFQAITQTERGEARTRTGAIWDAGTAGPRLTNKSTELTILYCTITITSKELFYLTNVFISIAGTCQILILKLSIVVYRKWLLSKFQLKLTKKNLWQNIWTVLS